MVIRIPAAMRAVARPPRTAAVGLLVAVLATTLGAGLVLVAAGEPARATVKGFVPLSPARVLDTRLGAPTSDGAGAPGRPVGPGETIELGLAGRAGMPQDGVGAVALNVTATEATEPSYVTVWPTDTPRPTASNLNMVPGQNAPNLVIAKVSASGSVSLYNYAGSTHLVADVLGWFPTGDAFGALAPARLLDTRPAGPTIDGQGAPGTAVGPDAAIDVTVVGRGGVPAGGVGAVVLNVTAAEATEPSYATVWPSDAPRPTASNVNTEPGRSVANLVIAKVSGDGRVSLYNYAGSTHLVADVLGWFPTGSPLNALSPARLLDTRPGAPTVDGQGSPGYQLGDGATVDVTVLGRAGVPASGVGAVVLNVTVAEPSEPSYISVWPTGEARPNASNLNMVAGQTVPNLVIAKVSTDGRVSLYNHAGSTHLIADVAGWFPGDAALAPPGAPQLEVGPKPVAPPAGVRITPGTSIQQTLLDNPEGATIVLAPGIYRETQIRPRNGQHIVGEYGAVVNGARVIGGWSQQGSVWVASGQPTAQPSFSGDCQPGFDLCGLSDDLYLGDTAPRRVGSRGAVGPGTWFYDYGAGQILLGDDPAGRTVEIALADQHAFIADQGVGGNGVEIRNLVIEKFGARGQECAVMAQDSGGGWQNVSNPSNGTSGGWLVKDNAIRLNHACGIFIGPGNVVEANFIHDNGQLGLKAAGRNIVIRGNEIARNNYNGFQTYWEAGGGKFWNAQNLLFAGNLTRDNLGSGIWADYALENIVYYGNTVSGNRNAGIVQEMTLSGRAINNVLTGNDWINRGNVGNSSGAIISYNGSNFEIANNVMVGNNGGVVVQAQDRGCIADDITQMQGQCPPGSVRATVEGVYVHDNFISLDDGRHGLIVLYATDYAPYAQHSAAYASSFFDGAKVRFANNHYGGVDCAPGSLGGNGLFTDERCHLVWAFPYGYSPGNDPDNLEAWTDQRLMWFAEWQSRVEPSARWIG